MRVLILYSDTGGGHRAASLAIKAALLERDPGLEILMVDGLVHGGPWPMNRSPAIYDWCMRWCRWLWAFFFHLWNSPFRARLMADLGYPGVARRLGRLLRDARADLVVSTHPLLTRSVARCLKKITPRPPFGIVVTDLVTGHWSWYDRGAERIFVPTPEAFTIVVKGGVKASQLVLTGQAVHPRCGRVVANREELRSRFGWNEPVILMVGGGDGMGNLGKRVRGVAKAKLPARLCVVCGRNEKLQRELGATSFDVAVEVHGFVQNLPELMAAADILVTKSGPGSIMEGCVAGLPILLYDYLPGQETGNVRLIEERGIGHYVPKVPMMVEALKEWLRMPDKRFEAARRSREFSTPDSALLIARGLLELVSTTRPSLPS